MSEYMFDITRYPDTVVHTCNNLGQLRVAMHKLGFRDRKFTHLTGLTETLTDEYKGILFVSSAPTNGQIDYSRIPPTTGADLAVLLATFDHDPAIEFYAKTPNKKLGGWELYGQIKGDDFLLVAERILVSGKAN